MNVLIGIYTDSLVSKSHRDSTPRHKTPAVRYVTGLSPMIPTPVNAEISKKKISNGSQKAQKNNYRLTPEIRSSMLRFKEKNLAIVS